MLSEANEPPVFDQKGQSIGMYIKLWISRFAVPGAVGLATILVCGAAVRAGGSPQGAKANPRAVSLNRFQKGVSAYLNLHKRVAAKIAPLKTTDSPAKIMEYQQGLAAMIRESRKNAKRGDIFTPQVSREFRRRIEVSLRDAQGVRIRASLLRGDPSDLHLAVNEVYPSTVPLETTPASLLLNLPRLPSELDYRIVGNSIILRDVTANLIVDYIPNVIP